MRLLYVICINAISSSLLFYNSNWSDRLTGLGNLESQIRTRGLRGAEGKWIEVRKNYTPDMTNHGGKLFKLRQREQTEVKKQQAYLRENNRIAWVLKACPPCWLSCSVLLLHCDRPTMATILAPRLERRFLFPARPVASVPMLLGLFSRLYMAPLMLELRNTFRGTTALIPPGLGTSTELLSIMVLHKPLGTELDWGWEEDRGWKDRCNNSITKHYFLWNFIKSLESLLYT